MLVSGRVLPWNVPARYPKFSAIFEVGDTFSNSHHCWYLCWISDFGGCRWFLKNGAPYLLFSMTLLLCGSYLCYVAHSGNIRNEGCKLEQEHHHHHQQQQQRQQQQSQQLQPTYLTRATHRSFCYSKSGGERGPRTSACSGDLVRSGRCVSKLRVCWHPSKKVLI